MVEKIKTQDLKEKKSAKKVEKKAVATDKNTDKN